MIVLNQISLFQKKDRLRKIKNGIIASMLRSIEASGYLSQEEYQEIRKIVMDGLNDFFREVLRELLGEVENGANHKKPRSVGSEVGTVAGSGVADSVYECATDAPKKGEFDIS